MTTSGLQEADETEEKVNSGYRALGLVNTGSGVLLLLSGCFCAMISENRMNELQS